jgi:hypothetical protein
VTGKRGTTHHRQSQTREGTMLARMGWFEWAMIAVVAVGLVAAVFVLSYKL